MSNEATSILGSKEIEALIPAVKAAVSREFKDIDAESSATLGASASYFRFQNETYCIFPAPDSGGIVGRIKDGKFEKVDELALPMCGS